MYGCCENSADAYAYSVIYKIDTVISHHDKENTSPISESLIPGISQEFDDTHDIYRRRHFLEPARLCVGDITTVTFEDQKYDVRIEKLWNRSGNSIYSGHFFGGPYSGKTSAQ